MHRRSEQHALTKAELRKLVEERADLTRQITTFGADIPTTPMFWKKEGNHLEWIVRQMSWSPPWCRDPASDGAPTRTRQRLREAPPATPVPEPAQASDGEDKDGAGVKDECFSDVEPVSEEEGRAAADATPVKEELPPCTETVTEAAARDSTTHPEKLWRAAPTQVMDDPHGYGRNPAFWYTLNFPYNYLYELHRFADATAELRRNGIPDAAEEPEKHQAFEEARATLETRVFGRVLCATVANPEATKVDPCDPKDRNSHNSRCTWVKANPDIAAFMHALRVELLVHYVMRHTVPASDAYPFQYWLRFEFGTSGNPHAHGLNYVAGNPTFDNVVADAATKKRLQYVYDDLKTVAEAEQ